MNIDPDNTNLDPDRVDRIRRRICSIIAQLHNLPFMKVVEAKTLADLGISSFSDKEVDKEIEDSFNVVLPLDPADDCFKSFDHLAIFIAEAKAKDEYDY